MKYLSAYMLLALSKEELPTSAEVKTLLESQGIAVDDNALSFALSKLEGKDLAELIEEGQERLVAGGGGGAGGAAGGAGGAAAEEEKKEEEEEEEEAVEVGNMFGGDDDGW
eukprot:g3401.t1